MNFLTLSLFLVPLCHATNPLSTPSYPTDPIPAAALPTTYPGALTAQSPAIENQIRDTLAHYPLAIDGKNFDALDRVFTQDAVANYSYPFPILTGLEQIKPALAQALAPVLTQHALSTTVIEIAKGEKEARSVAYFTATHLGTSANTTGKVLYSYAQYQDNWVKIDEGWRIKHRNLVYMGPNIGDVSVFTGNGL